MPLECPRFACLLLLALACMAALDPARLQAQPPSAAPSQQLRTDPGEPYPSIAVVADPLAMVFGRYGVRFDAAVGRMHGLWLGGAWVRGASGGMSLRGGYHLWPLGRGLHGVRVGPSAGVTLAGSQRVAAVSLGGEIGYQHVWDGLVLGGGVGVGHRWKWRQGQRARGISVRVRTAIGWAWP